LTGRVWPGTLSMGFTEKVTESAVAVQIPSISSKFFAPAGL
jgi:hypothetical protein